jgi:hydroxymethylglutaryl-CoA synthase
LGPDLKPDRGQEMSMDTGILSAGGYVPRLRLQRKAIAEAHGWFNGALRGLGKGERAMANWDEDAVTMAVEAARDALEGQDRTKIAALRFASTTFPFLDRLNAGIVTDALSLDGDPRAFDLAASQRAGTSALLDALLGRETTLVVASEKRPSLAASPFEMTSGDGAAALVVGSGDAGLGEPIARLLGHASRTVDFVDHYRTMENPTDYQWEERWIRDAGYSAIVPPVIKACLDRAGVAAADVTCFIMPSTLARLGPAMARAAGIPDTTVADTLMEICGDTGAAHPLVMLVAALESAKAGDRILVVGFGQGADALLFEVTPAIANARRGKGVAGHLARRRAESNYSRFLTTNDTIAIERGMRAEADKQTALSALWRNRDAVTAFSGGLCTQCGTRQFPKTRICVNPNCNAVDTQVPEPFAEKTGEVASYTADRLTYSPDPPACYGMIRFAEGGRWMMDFTDVDEADLAVGMPMKMMFRIKDFDAQRGFRRYFWKAAPASAGRN